MKFLVAIMIAFHWTESSGMQTVEMDFTWIGWLPRSHHFQVNQKRNDDDDDEDDDDEKNEILNWKLTWINRMLTENGNFTQTILPQPQIHQKMS